MSPTGVYEHRARTGRERGDVGPIGRALVRAMNTRGMLVKSLAAQTGISATSIIEARNGTVIPNHGTIVKYAEALDWPSLVDYSVRLRLKACVVCRRATLGTGNQKRLYCSKECRVVAVRRRVTASRAYDGTIARHRLTLHQEAVAAFCRGCEPEGICRTADCPLRPVSPFPVVAAPLVRIRRVG